MRGISRTCFNNTNIDYDDNNYYYYNNIIKIIIIKYY